MAFRTVSLPETIKGKMFVDAMPGSEQSWPEFLAEASSVGLDTIVSLTSEDEIRRHSPSYLTALTEKKLPCDWRSVAMRDLGLASNEGAFRAQVKEVAAKLSEGKTVLIHCAGGRGRTGTMAACVLKTMGLPRDEAIQRVQDAGSSAESATQTGMIDRF